MSLFKRKDSSLWWVKFSVNGRRIQESTGTDDRKQAQEYHDRRKAELWEQSRLGVKAAHTWQEAVVRWLRETQHKKSHQDDVQRLRWLDQHLRGVRLSEIDRGKIDAIVTAKAADGAANGTINRHLALIRSILRRAMDEWEWLDRVPKVRLLPEPKLRVRYLEQEDFRRLLVELPEHLASLVVFSLETGLRQSNVKELTWSQVDMERGQAWIHADQAKGKKAFNVPLSGAALSVIRQQVGKHPVYVFSFRGKPIRYVNNSAWKSALKRAGITDFRWHDLRHTWATWHRQKDTPLDVLQELGAWKSPEMVRRYAHLSGDHLRRHVRDMTE